MADYILHLRTQVKQGRLPIGTIPPGDCELFEPERPGSRYIDVAEYWRLRAERAEDRTQELKSEVARLQRTIDASKASIDVSLSAVKDTVPSKRKRGSSKTKLPAKKAKSLSTGVAQSPTTVNGLLPQDTGTLDGFGTGKS